MNVAPSGRETSRKTSSTKVQPKAQSTTGCSFCWFVLTLYPTLNGMTDGDTETFREHLKMVHGLKQDITE